MLFFWCAFIVETAKELATKSLYIQSKKFYIDVKENRRGKFIKLSEVLFCDIVECLLCSVSHVSLNTNLLVHCFSSLLKHLCILSYFLCVC